MKFAFADPPYYGTAARTYGKIHPEAAAYDRLETHAALIDRLCDQFPDGWALSCHEPSLRAILNLCPKNVRVGVWISQKAKFPPEGAVKRHWEPVIWSGGRDGCRRCGDYVVSVNGGAIRPPEHRQSIARGAPGGNPAAAVGAGREHFGGKPPEFCAWIFDLLGARKGDEFHDLFPGSGAVSAAWAKRIGEQPELELTPLEKIAHG